MGDSAAAVAAGLASAPSGAWFDHPGAVARLIEFNLLPDRYAHVSWLSRIGLSGTTSSPGVVGTLQAIRSAALLEGVGLAGCYDWALEQPIERMFLMERYALDSVAIAVGTARQRHALRKVVRRDEVAMLNSALGQWVEALWLPMAEAVPPAARPIQDVIGKARRGELQSCLKAEGILSLVSLLPGGPATLGRACLHLPAELLCEGGGVCASSWNSPVAPPESQIARRAAAAITAEFVPRWEPGWSWLF